MSKTLIQQMSTEKLIELKNHCEYSFCDLVGDEIIIKHVELKKTDFSGGSIMWQIFDELEKRKVYA